MRKCLCVFILLFTVAGSCYSMGGSPQEEKGKDMSKNNPKVVMETSKGKMTIELYEDKAPITVKNFLGYAGTGFYDGTIFHRVIPGFMIQGGGMTPGLNEKMVLSPIKNEAGNGLKNKRGTLAMARTNVVDSATAQFFINSVDNDFLDHKGEDPSSFGYCVFGAVVDGLNVVDAISSVPTKTSGYFDDVPVEDVIIKSVKVQAQ